MYIFLRKCNYSNANLIPIMPPVLGFRIQMTFKQIFHIFLGLTALLEMARLNFLLMESFEKWKVMLLCCEKINVYGYYLPRRA